MEEIVEDGARDNHMKTRTKTRSKQQLCKPYPFQQYHSSHRYISGSLLDIPESGPSNCIEPCHEFKSFQNTPKEQQFFKFARETIRFAAGCMNSRTNGTIHFGIGDKPHGEVLGVVVEDKEIYANSLKSAVKNYFVKPGDPDICIKCPRFVEVLNNNETSSHKFVIEVDVVPESIICQEHFYFTNKLVPAGDKSDGSDLYFRDGSSTKNLKTDKGKKISNAQYKEVVARVAKSSQLRKQNEEKQRREIKCRTQGFQLIQLITQGHSSLDECHLEYVIATNKSHPKQFESLQFLTELNPRAILDFDPESADHGLQHHFESQMAVNLCLAEQYNITGANEAIAAESKSTSWIFCNGGIKEEAPSDLEQWSKDKGDSVQHLIYSLCRKDVTQNKRILVIFLLLSPVSEENHPLVYTLRSFCQQLSGTNQILCICDSENTFIWWKDVVKAQCGIDISGRCIHELSFAEVNGTVLSLSSGNRRAKRFLTGGGGSNVLLKKTVERELNALEVLCVNQCEEGHEDKTAEEENFYRGTKMSWWSFHYLDKGESSVVPKRGHVRSISDHILHTWSHTSPCELFCLWHKPACDGTTVAKHVLWELRNKFRCAVLKDGNVNVCVADQVNQLLMYGCKEQLPHVPVLLLLDDFADMRNVYDLQKLIEAKCKKNITTTQVIILYCFSSDCEPTEVDGQTYFIENEHNSQPFQLGCRNKESALPIRLQETQEAVSRPAREP